MENRKTKSLYNITIEKINFNTLLRYNINTNHIEISTKFNYQNPNKTKQYYEANKEKINAYNKAYYETNRKPTTPRFGSEEFKIKISCSHQGINITEFNGFLQDKNYCKLWTEK